MSLFVVRKPEDLAAHRCKLANDLLALAHEKLMLQLQLGTVIDRQHEITEELAAIELRMKETA